MQVTKNHFLAEGIWIQAPRRDGNLVNHLDSNQRGQQSTGSGSM
jgi:hypothetical protein